MNDYRGMPDQMLAYVVRQLEMKVHALRAATSAIGIALLQDYRERLDLARGELERRHE